MNSKVGSRSIEPFNPGPTPAFFVLEASDISDTLKAAFTPKVMQWQEDIWIFDLKSCQRYWRTQALFARAQPEELLERLLRKELGTEPYRSVTAADPWQALCLLGHLRERSLTGFVRGIEPIGKNLLGQMTWTTWCATAEVYGRHCTALKVPRFTEAVFKRQLRQLQQAMGRLNQALPKSLSAATSPAMRRRFGPHVALLWEWTYQGPVDLPPAQKSLFDDDSRGPFTTGFPWITWTPTVKPRVTTHLDYSVWQWDQVEPFLCHDLDRLCDDDRWTDDEAVLHLSWSLRLDDGAECLVDLIFRHPHRLHAEKGEHKTTLTQAAGSFEARFQKAQSHEDGCAAIPIVGWQLVIESRMCCQPLSVDLFGDDADSNDSLEAMKIENQLPVALQYFNLKEDWVPERSFGCGPVAKVKDHGISPWLSIASKRPLYTYDIPRPATWRDRPGSFTERTSLKWWEGTELKTSVRDYFILLDGRGKRRWAYQDEKGTWCVHGVFA